MLQQFIDKCATFEGVSRHSTQDNRRAFVMLLNRLTPDQWRISFTCDPQYSKNISCQMTYHQKFINISLTLEQFLNLTNEQIANIHTHLEQQEEAYREAERVFKNMPADIKRTTVNLLK